MLRFVLTGNGHEDVAKPQLLPSCLCQDSFVSPEQQKESDRWISLVALFQEYIAESGACIKLSCLNQNLMLQETVQAKQQFWTMLSQNQPSQDSTPPPQPPSRAREIFKWGEPNSYCVQRGLRFGSRLSSDILQNGFYCYLLPNEALIDAEEK